MGITTFRYSKIVGWTGALFFGGTMIFIIVMGISVHDNTYWRYFGPFELFPATILYFFCKKCFIPAVKNKIALELDADKLQFHVTDRVIYWKDVNEISQTYSMYSSFISFEMVDGSDDIGIGTKWIAGSNDMIYDTIQEYFAEALKINP